MESQHPSVLWESLWWKTSTSVMSGSSFLHAGGFRFGDVLVVGLVLQLSAEVLDRFVQAFFQRDLVQQVTAT